MAFPSSPRAKGMHDVWRRQPSRHRGGVLVYIVMTMTALMGICSLAVDLGRIQAAKTEIQSCADATARAYIEYYSVYGTAYANSNGPQLYASSNNPVDSGSGVSPTVSVVWGYWNTSSNTFSTSSGTATAVKVTVSRSAANGNPISLFWGGIVGAKACDVSVTSIAALMGGQTTSQTISGLSNPYFAGMPNTTTNSYGDNFTTDAPIQVTAVPVVPGQWLTFTSTSGTTCVLPGYVSSAGDNGVTSIPVHHGQNYNYTINNPGPENGIADAIMSESAFMGLFLDNTQPDSTAAPATVDWTSSSIQNQPTYTNLLLKQPFLIGDGKTSGGTVQQFQVPPGATRLFLAVWDGTDYNNNTGSLTTTVTVQPYVQMMQ